MKKPMRLGEKWRVWKCWSKNEWLDSFLAHQFLVNIYKASA
jgi:hypothetical protein